MSRELRAALARWERFGRPGIPQRGFALSRLPGRTRLGIYQGADQHPVWEPAEQILRMTPAPDGRQIAVELAARADERAILAILDTSTGRAQRFPELGCRYDPVRWRPDGVRLDLVASRCGQLVTLDTRTGRWSGLPVPSGERWRIFAAGTHGVIAASRAGLPTRLTEHNTGTFLGEYRSVHQVLSLPQGALIWCAAGLQAIGLPGGRPQWSWTDPEITLTEVACNGEQVLASGVRAGRSILLNLDRGRLRSTREAVIGDEPAVVSGLGLEAGRPLLRVEGPLHPPRIVDSPEVPGSAMERPRARTHCLEVAADDGARITVVVTSPHEWEQRPLILTCYGGFGVPSLPVFEPTVPAWVEQGGHYAVAQIRGGGEHGRAWRAAGHGPLKHRAVADLAAAAQGLIAAGYTDSRRLVLAGSSHGGVIAASCGLSHPRRCAAVIATAAPLDLLRLSDHPLGTRWISEFGDPGSAAGRQRLADISPIQRASRWPPGPPPPDFLGIVLEDDSRVAAADTQRLVAELNRAGGHAELWRAPHTGHGGNRLDSLHELGARILGFAHRVTSIPEAKW